MKYTYGKCRVTKGIVPFEGTDEHNEARFNVSLNGMFGRAVKNNNILTRFSHFDPIKQRCKLCYEECYSYYDEVHQEYIMYRKADKKPHRVRIGNNWYCSMSKSDL